MSDLKCSWPGCTKTEPTPGALAAHRKVHTNVRVDCEHCSFRPLAHNLAKHVRTKHEDHHEHLDVDLRSLEDQSQLIREQAELIAELTRDRDRWKADWVRVDGLRERYWNKLKSQK